MDATKSGIFKQVILMLVIMQAGGMQAGDRDIFHDVENKSLVKFGVALVLGFCAKNMFYKRKSNKPAKAIISPYDTTQNISEEKQRNRFISRMLPKGTPMIDNPRFFPNTYPDEYRLMRVWVGQEKEDRPELEALWRQDNENIKKYTKKRPRDCSQPLKVSFNHATDERICEGELESAVLPGGVTKQVDGNPRYPNYRAYEESMTEKIKSRRQKQGLEQH